MKEESKENIQDRIQIVEFEESYAESLAEMWNVSKEEWGGQDGNKTATQVTTGIRNEGNIKDFIALEGTTVVGYCSFKEYEDDEGACYIPLLNVRPEYHGKKIGKKLLLKALEVAVKEQWPRMDLYTWSSNLKAVPLYKKCGFFWEKDNPHIHLMNFMPTVLNTEAITEYLRDLDWYKDVARDLSVEPDGRVEKGFHFYEYLWQNEKETLKVEFCRRGRGLRLIDNKDYKVVCYTDQNEFAYGKSYPVYYQVINKTRKPLSLKLKGKDDKNIRYSFSKTLVVDREEIIKASFYVDEIEELYHNDLTHPTIATELQINGKKAEFRLGIVPKFPLDITFKIPEKESFVGMVTKGFIDLENGFEEEVKVEFNLLNSPELQWEEEPVSLVLKGKEKKSLPVYFRVLKQGFYQQVTNIHLKLSNEELTFQKEVKGFVRGRRGKFYGAMEEGWSVVNGAYKLTLIKHENVLKIENLEKASRDVIFYPKMGLPFGTDFSNKEPMKVSYETEEDLICLRAVYLSKNFPGIRLHSVSELFSDGIVKQYYEVENTSEAVIGQDLWVSTGLYHPFADSLLSYDGEIIQLEGMEESRLVYYDTDKFTENWIYAKVKETSWAMVWPKDIKPETEGPFLKINENLGRVDKGEKRATKPVYMLFNTMKDWKELQRFAMEGEDRNDVLLQEPVKTFDVQVNGKNPFVTSPISIAFNERKADCLSGTILLESESDLVESLEKVYEEDEALRTDTIKTELKTDLAIDPGMDCLRFSMDLKKTRRVLQRQIFPLGTEAIEKNTEKSKLEQSQHRNGQVVSDGLLYQVNNGRLTFSSDPDFSNGLISITMDGKEMLDSSYPEYVSKFPWNPWAGGIYFVPMDYELESMLQEKRRGQFAQKVDSKGNRWEGIKVITGLDGLEKYKGLEIHQYFLTLPGVPVMITLFEIKQETGKYLEDLELQNMMFFRPDPDLTNAYFAKGVASKEKVEIKAGKYLVAHNTKDKALEVGSKISSEKVLMYAPKGEHVIGFTNKEMLITTVIEKLSGENQTTKTFDPVFLIFSKKSLEVEAIEDLKGIRF